VSYKKQAGAQRVIAAAVGYRRLLFPRNGILGTAIVVLFLRSEVSLAIGIKLMRNRRLRVDWSHQHARVDEVFEMPDG